MADQLSEAQQTILGRAMLQGEGIEHFHHDDLYFSGRWLVDGEAVKDLFERKLIEVRTDHAGPDFTAYQLTPAGRRAWRIAHAEQIDW